MKITKKQIEEAKKDFKGPITKLEPQQNLNMNSAKGTCNIDTNHLHEERNPGWIPVFMYCH
jgi:hypothetical protein